MAKVVDATPPTVAPTTIADRSRFRGENQRWFCWVETARVLQNPVTIPEFGQMDSLVGTAYYDQSRTHLSLNKDAPILRPIAAPGDGRVGAIPQVGGLHHRHERQVA